MKRAGFFLKPLASLPFSCFRIVFSCQGAKSKEAYNGRRYVGVKDEHESHEEDGYAV